MDDPSPLNRFRKRPYLELPLDRWKLGVALFLFVLLFVSAVLVNWQ